VGARREAVVAMRMSVVMHCAVAFWWGALILLFLCEVPLVLFLVAFCVVVDLCELILFGSVVKACRWDDALSRVFVCA
jgi:hypothetical protein